MRIYLAGGMTVINVIGRERELAFKLEAWNRLFSYHFLDLIFKSEILDIIRENLHGREHCREDQRESTC